MLMPMSIGPIGGVAANSFDVSAFSYSSTSFDISGQSSIARSVRFGDSGGKMYVLNFNDIIYQYSLSTDFDISTASYDSKSFTTTTQASSPYDIAFNPSGTKLYVLDTAAGTSIYQYSLSTAWDISTASYDSVSFSYGTQDGFATGLFFGDSGSKMYVLGFNNNTVYQYTLSTAWDLSTASYASKSFDHSSQGTSMEGIAFTSDGASMILINTSTDDEIYQYDLSTAWDVSTASYASKSLTVGSQDSNATGIDLSDDDTILIMVGHANDNVYEYTL